MQMQVEVITPEVAKSLLLLNFGNRPMNSKHIARLARAMANGEWELNGEAIKLSDNRLIDGQQRLEAVIKSNTPIQTVVMRGLKEEVFHTLDGNRKRSPADILSVHGEVSCTVLAAALKWVDAYQSGRLLAGHVKPAQDYSNHDHLELLEENPTLRRSIRVAEGVRRLTKLTLAAALHYLFSQVSEEQADGFFQELRYGEGLGKTDPVYLLRERLIDNISAKAKMTDRYVLALFIKAWNAKREGAQIRQLAFREAGAFPETFPTIK